MYKGSSINQVKRIYYNDNVDNNSRVHLNLFNFNNYSSCNTFSLSLQSQQTPYY